MNVRWQSSLIVAAVLMISLAAVAALRETDFDRYNPFEKAFYLSNQDAEWIRPGLKFEITNVTIPQDRKPVVTFKISDDKGQPLDLDGNLTPGQVVPRFLIAYLPENGAQYVNYILRTVTSSTSGKTATQPTSDSGGRYTKRADGEYTYTFGTALPLNYDTTVTHTVGVYATRDLREFGLSRYVANPYHRFVPDGRQVTSIREVVLTANCNECHNPLALHGGARQETQLCILCHTPQNSDPDTGNTVDFKVMVHKIHRGADLPSSIAGNPYKIIGFGGNVFDVSEIHFPQDVRNCQKCHKNAAQGNNYLLKPTRVTCGACHDDVNFASGEKHPGGSQPDDRFCATCHWPEGEYEYDATIAGAHTVPWRSKQLRYPKFEILSTDKTGPGQKPVIQFKITDKDGKAVSPSAMARLSLRLAGPTTDYKWYISETATGASYANGVATYTFSGSLPADATGTYTVGIEGYLNTPVNPGTVEEFTYRDAGDNVIKEFPVTGKVTPRRKIVDIAKCNRCHDRLQLHGNNRNQTEYCVGCHNPVNSDVARRPADQGKPETIHFKVLIHRIHSGHDLENDYTVYGFGGRPFNANEVHFPGDRRDCETCHLPGTYTVPITKDALPTDTLRWFWSPTLPTAAACLGCHDGVDTAAHAYVNTAEKIGESCSVCHKEGAEFAVTKMHAR